MSTGAWALARHICPGWHRGAHPCGGLGTRSWLVLGASLTSRLLFAQASACPVQGLAAPRCWGLGPGVPEKRGWSCAPCQAQSARSSRPASRPRRWAVRCRLRWSGEREPSACLPQPGSSGSARTPRSLPPGPPPGCSAALRVPPQPFHRGAERAPSRSIFSPDEDVPQQPRWPFPRLTPNAFQLPGAQKQHRCFRHNCTMPPNREQSLPTS